MSKSEIFKKAHEIARNTVALVGDYMIAFSIALKNLYKEGKKMAATMQQKLEALGLTVWEGGQHKRIYISDKTEEIFGLKINTYGTGSISNAFLNGKKISNNKARKFLEDNPYYDCNAKQFVGIDLEPIL